jgi:hypothetical protein
VCFHGKLLRRRDKGWG